MKHLVALSDPFGGNSDSINDFLVLNIGWRVTKDRSISFEIGAWQQRDRCQNFSSGHNFMDKSVDWSQVSKKKPFQIIHYFFHVTNNRAISFEIGNQHQPDQCQNFSLGHNFMDQTANCCWRSKNRPAWIIHRFGQVTTNWRFSQKAPLFIFIQLLKWSCLGHNKMNQSKYPE